MGLCNAVEQANRELKHATFFSTQTSRVQNFGVIEPQSVHFPVVDFKQERLTPFLTVKFCTRDVRIDQNVACLSSLIYRRFLPKYPDEGFSLNASPS